MSGGLGKDFNIMEDIHKMQTFNAETESLDSDNVGKSTDPDIVFHRMYQRQNRKVNEKIKEIRSSLL